MLCDQIGVQCCTQITYVHSSGRAGGKSGSYFAHDVSPFHFWCVQRGYNDPLSLIIHPAAQIHKTIFIHKHRTAKSAASYISICINTAPLFRFAFSVHLMLLLSTRSTINIKFRCLLHRFVLQLCTKDHLK